MVVQLKIYQLLYIKKLFPKIVAAEKSVEISRERRKVYVLNFVPINVVSVIDSAGKVYRNWVIRFSEDPLWKYHTCANKWCAFCSKIIVLAVKFLLETLGGDQ